MHGKDIFEISTINSMYANGYLNVYTEDRLQKLRLHVREILKMVEYFEFDEVKSKHYIHLKNPKLKV